LGQAFFVALVKEELEAQADAQERLAFAGLCLDGLGDGGELLHGVAAGADAGQNQAFGLCEIGRVATDGDVRADKAERVNDASDISGTIINNYKHTNSSHYFKTLYISNRPPMARVDKQKDDFLNGSYYSLISR
jgi:hypothetical protein